MEAFQPVLVVNFLVHAAGISPPWRASKVRIDEVTKTAHVWITRHPPPNAGRRRRWFGRGEISASTEVAASGPEMQWRHLNCMDYSCQIHTVDALETGHHELPWLGQPGLPFSNRLSRQVFACLMEGMEMSAICAMLNIPFADLWKFAYALDNGRVTFAYTPAKKTRAGAAVPASLPASSFAGDGETLPDVTDPVWARLITGELDIRIKTLSFQLMLTKLRRQVSLQQSDEVKLMKLRELHRYVERNARSLGYELQQLHGLIGRPLPESP